MSHALFPQPEKWREDRWETVQGGRRAADPSNREERVGKIWRAPERGGGLCDVRKGAPW